MLYNKLSQFKPESRILNKRTKLLTMFKIDDPTLFNPELCHTITNPNPNYFSIFICIQNLESFFTTMKYSAPFSLIGAVKHTFIYIKGQQCVHVPNPVGSPNDGAQGAVKQ